jgi:nicotinamidase-related amidase
MLRDIAVKKLLSEKEWHAYLKSHHGERMGFGARPAVIVVDMTYAFVDPSHLMASGDRGWQAVKRTRELLDAARKKSAPTIYTKPSEKILQNVAAGTISRKLISGMREALSKPRGNDIVDEVAPAHGDIILEKAAASAFFGTDLIRILTYYGVDTVIVAGATTSGCVRATVVDAASYNYFVIVPEECVADRAELPHLVSLFDMDMKYADVLKLAEVLEYFAHL